MAKMSKEMPLQVYAKKVGINKKEQDWIVKNDKDTHYVNNSALPKAWTALSYPIYDGDYYFAFIHDKVRVNAKYNAEANRELRRYIKSFLDENEIYDRMEKFFAMKFKDAGSGDTMTREELWTAIVNERERNPVREGKSLKKESVMDTYRQMWRDASDIVEVTDKEINAMKKVSKDMQKVLVSYQKIANMGDKELKNTKHNYDYEQVLKARDTIISMIGKLQTKQTIEKSFKREELEEKLSKADLKMIDMMYDKKGKLTDVGRAVMNYKPGDNIRKIVQNLNNKKEEVTEVLSKIQRGKKLQKKDISNVEDHIMKSYLDKKVKDKIAFDDDSIYLQRSGKTIMTSRDYVGKMDIDMLIRTLEKKVK